VAALVAAGSLIVLEGVPPIDLAMWDPHTTRFWVRQSVSLLLFGVAVLVAQVYVVERLAEEARRFRVLLERERRSRLELERAEREREEERERREQAQHALEKARRTESLARLSGGIAHDFNNALTVIFAVVDMLRTKNFRSLDDVQKAADEIDRAAEGAAELTRQLLTLGRQQVSEPRPLALGSFLRHFTRALRRVLPSDVKLEVDEPSQHLTAFVDASLLERALFNLALNARDAMPNGGKLSIHSAPIALRSHPGLVDGNYVVLRVSDDGQGMDRETQERIFEPFFTTKDSGVGSGLGLATVYAFVKEAGGDVSVSSEPGQGTCFTLYLPATSEDETRAVAPTPSERRAHRALPKRILVVEDRADVLSSMVNVLSSHGFDVAAAPDGDKAVELLAATSPFALMCIDGVMPGTPTASVVEFAQRRHPSMRILLCSGHVRDDLLRRGITVGQIAFLAKPFKAEALLTSVRSLLGTEDTN